MVQRNFYDMSHYAHVTSLTGRLQTIKCYHVMGGESWNFNINGVVRQSPLRRDLTVDAVIDTFMFYCPYRQVYGDDWMTFIKDGRKEQITFPSGPAIGTKAPEYLGFPQGTWTGTVPYHYVASYNNIWNWYFRVRSDTAGKKALNYLETLNDGLQGGSLCTRLPSQWSEIFNENEMPDASDRSVPAAADTLDLIDFANVKGQYESEIIRAWFGQEYEDIMESQFGGTASHDAQDKPILVWHDRSNMSGYDIDGTDETTLGQFAGKSLAPVNINIPRKFFPEHGLCFLMQLIRFPTISEREHNYLANQQDFDYVAISGDPMIHENLEPQDLVLGDIFANTTSSTVLGKVPAGWYYRSEPSYVHTDFREVQGFPFVTTNPTDTQESWYHRNTEYSDMFQTLSLGHARTHLRIGASKYSPMPEAIRSIYAGV